MKICLHRKLLASFLSNLIIIALGNLTAFAQNTWIQKANYGGGVTISAVGFAIGNKGYIGLGDNGMGTQFQQIWEYDPATDVWTQKADFGGGTRSNATAFTIGGKAYVGTGYNSVAQRDFWEYDQATNTWTQKADFAGGDRIRMAAFSIGSKGYVGTGSNGTFFNDFWEYDPALDTWTAKANFPGPPRQSATGFSIGPKGYIGTGWGTSANFNDFYEYDPATDTWIQRADVGPTPRYEAVGFSIGSKGYVATGGLWPVYTKDLFEYDPAIDCWTKRADFGGIGRSLAAGFSVGGKGYVGTAVFQIDIWEYTPAASLPPPTISSFAPSSGVVGDVIAINGTNFDPNPGNTIVSFNGTPATISSASSTDLSVVVPTGAATGPIEVAVGCNSVLSLSDFTVLVPIPSISGFTPNAGPVGTFVTITGANFDPALLNNTVKFNGTNAIVTSSTTTSITTFVPAGATTGPISVTVAGNTASSSTDFTVTAAPDNSIKFNGTNQRAQLGTWFNYQNFTIAMWVKPGATQVAYADIVDNRHGSSINWVLQQDFVTTNRYCFGAGGVCTFVNLTANTWQHLTLVANAGTYSIYLNGCLAAQSVGGPIVYDGNQMLGIGSYSDGTMRYWSGEIDELKIYDRALAAAEVLTAAYTPESPTTPNLLAYYKMNQVGGTAIYDESPNVRTGSLLNNPAFQLTGIPTSAPLPPTIASFTPASRVTGSTVIITGSNFDPTPANNIVKFNGTTAVVTASTATSITTSVPSGATTGVITVTIGCNTATSASSFAVPLCFPVNGQNADVVLGQTNFTTNTSGSGANKFTGVGGICIHHGSGKVFIADQANHRILRFTATAAATTGSSAEAVLGQPDFTTITAGLSQTKLNNPIGLAIDQVTGTLWVADYLNNRVLRFDNAISLPNGAPANGVLGQPDFITNSSPTVSATKLGGPTGVALDASGNLWTAERPWNRVLKFSNAASLANGAAASVVLGQTDFVSNSPGTSQSKFDRTNSVTIDALGNLWVADELNDRVLKFANANSLTSGANATTVLGQSDFSGNSFATAQNRMYGPIGIHADLMGNLWVGDWANQRALQFANAASLANGANATRVLGSPNFTTIAGGTAQNRTGVVWAVAVDNFGNVFVGDQGNNRILRFSAPAATSLGASICSNASTTLTASGALALQEYRWYDVPTGGTSLSSLASFTTSSLTSTTTYYISLVDAVCSYESGRSAVVVTIIPPAAAPFTFSGSACGPSSSVILSASGASNGQYRWYLTATGGTAIAGEVNDTYFTPVLAATTTYYVSVDDGTCESTRTAVDAIINPLPVAPTSSGGSSCGPGIVTLTGTGGTNGQYRWYEVATGGSAIAGEVNGTLNTPSLTTSTDYYVSINDGTCESARTAVTATINAIPPAPGVTDGSGCLPSASVTLAASGATNGQYRWYTQATGGSPITGAVNDSYTTPALSLSATYYVSINDGCEGPRASVLAEIKNCPTPPVIETAALTTQIEGTVSLDLVSKITTFSAPLDLSSITITKQPISGAKATIDNGTLNLDYTGRSFSGTDRLTIQACDQLVNCASQEFTVEVVGDIVVFNAISANNDNKNETFFLQYIDIIAETKNNSVKIFDRWGDIVFETENYDNTTNVFKGLNKSGDALPSGTYYYKIEFASGLPARTGFISLKK